MRLQLEVCSESGTLEILFSRVAGMHVLCCSPDGCRNYAPLTGGMSDAAPSVIIEVLGMLVCLDRS